MSAMMGQLLADAAVRGEALAALFASESGIYQRFGFGCASQSMRCTIQRGDGALIGLAAPGLPGPVRIRVAAPASVEAEMASVYAAAVAARPGGPARDERWWQNPIADPAGPRRRGAPRRGVTAAVRHRRGRGRPARVRAVRDGAELGSRRDRGE